MVLATTATTPDRFLSDAINYALLELAIEAGFTSEHEEVDADEDGTPIYADLPNAADLTRMARQPLTVAALLYDLCLRMGETPPAYLVDALTAAEPF